MVDRLRLRHISVEYVYMDTSFLLIIIISCIHDYNPILSLNTIYSISLDRFQRFNILERVISVPTEFSQQLKMNTLWILAAWTLQHFTLSAGFSSSILSLAVENESYK